MSQGNPPANLTNTTEGTDDFANYFLDQNDIAMAGIDDFPDVTGDFTLQNSGDNAQNPVNGQEIQTAGQTEIDMLPSSAFNLDELDLGFNSQLDQPSGMGQQGRSSVAPFPAIPNRNGSLSFPGPNHVSYQQTHNPQLSGYPIPQTTPNAFGQVYPPYFQGVPPPGYAYTVQYVPQNMNYANAHQYQMPMIPQYVQQPYVLPNMQRPVLQPYPPQNQQPQMIQPLIQPPTIQPPTIQPPLTQSPVTQRSLAQPPIIQPPSIQPPAQPPLIQPAQPPQPPIPQPAYISPYQPPQTSVNPTGQRQLAFTNLAQAEAALENREMSARTTWEPNPDDPSIPKSDEEQAQYVRELYDAMEDITESVDGYRHWTVEKNATPYYNTTHVEKVCWMVVSKAIALHTQGPRVLAIYDSNMLAQVRSNSYLTFRGRISAICALLRYSKSRCDRLMKGEGFEISVAAPDHILGQSKVNKTMNKRREARLRKGMEIEKAELSDDDERELRDGTSKRSRDEDSEEETHVPLRRKRARR